MRTRPSRLFVGFLLALSACSGKDADDSAAVADTTASAAETAPAADVAPPAAADTVLAPEDLDRYQRGVQKEIEVLKDAQQRKAEAKTGNDTLEVLASAQEWELRPQAAKAAGVEESRWQFIRDRVESILAKRENAPAMMAQFKDVDTTSMPAEQRAQVRENMQQAQAAFGGDPFAGLPPATAEAFRARADDLNRLRNEYLQALAKVSGLAAS